MANTGVPLAAMAAAAWSWVEKMLQDAQRTSAPSALSVSMSTAVWIVMCSEPAMRAPVSGRALAYSSRIAIRAGISPSAMAISLRPHSPSRRSVTLKSEEPLVCGAALITPSPLCEKKVRERRCQCRGPEPGGRRSGARCNAPREHGYFTPDRRDGFPGNCGHDLPGAYL